MTKAIRIHETGGPEVLRWDDVDVGTPGEGQLRLRHTAIGLNYIDTYHRTGLYPIAMPGILGLEAAGVVEEIGAGVTNVAVGQRVAYVGPIGAYCQERLFPAARAIPIPDGISDEQAAGMMLKGMTVQYLIRQTYNVKAGDTVLAHAAAGGVGTIMCQWLKHLGATVIGTVGSDEKAELAKANGCDYPIVYTRENFADRVKEITDGKLLPVVYDSVGADTFAGSLDCLRPRGMMVSFGNATGPVTGFNLGVLAQKGSLFLTRPTLMAYTTTPAELLACAADLFDVVAAGHVKIAVNQSFALKDVADAHRALESRQTTGSTILKP